MDVMDPAAARKHVNTHRYIDDVIAVDNNIFEKNVRIEGRPYNHTTASLPSPLYPAYLRLEATYTDGSGEADYLGMLLQNSSSSVLMDVAPARKNFPAAKINNPSLHGNFPAVLGYGVFTGQLHRFARICTATQDFVKASIGLYSALRPKGYSIRQLLKRFSAFMNKHNPYRTRKSILVDVFKQRISALPRFVQQQI